MRARFAVVASGQRCELREVVLRDKPPELAAASAKATVPVLVLADGTVIDQSIEIMRWALGRSDPWSWLAPQQGRLADLLALVDDCEREFKPRLDRYKYPERHPGGDPSAERSAAAGFLLRLDALLRGQASPRHAYLFGMRASLADMAIAPFVRQFAQVAPAWFDAEPWPALRDWLGTIVASEAWQRSMDKHPRWKAGDTPLLFPPETRTDL
ncbi:MAG: glutathione S-transferase [Comamonadaceae bacterium]|nr:MAG: glutathione S-transferase [Comamonadaceae bacterium]